MSRLSDERAALLPWAVHAGALPGPPPRSMRGPRGERLCDLCTAPYSGGDWTVGTDAARCEGDQGARGTTTCAAGAWCGSAAFGCRPSWRGSGRPSTRPPLALREHAAMHGSLSPPPRRSRREPLQRAERSQLDYRRRGLCCSQPLPRVQGRSRLCRGWTSSHRLQPLRWRSIPHAARLRVCYLVEARSLSW